MKWFARSIVFAGTLFFGIGAAAIGLEVRPYMELRDIEVEGPDPETAGTAPDPKGIHVMYAGIGTNGDAKEQYLKFIVHNGGDEPLTYPGYWADHSFPVLRANSKELEDRNYCWNGYREFAIPPGRSAQIHITHDEFLSRPSKNTLVEVGFNLRPASASERSIRYSEPFPLPEGFRKTISVK